MYFMAILLIGFSIESKREWWNECELYLKSNIEVITLFCYKKILGTIKSSDILFI